MIQVGPTAYRASGLVVVEVHGAAQVSRSLVDVDEISREPVAERAVVAAAAPLPITTRTCLPRARCARKGGGARGGAATGAAAPAARWPRPLPAAAPGWAGDWQVGALSIAARAGVYSAGAAGASYGVRQRGACDGVDERRLTTTCTHRQKQVAS